MHAYIVRVSGHHDAAACQLHAESVRLVNVRVLTVFPPACLLLPAALIICCRPRPSFVTAGCVEKVTLSLLPSTTQSCSQGISQGCLIDRPCTRPCSQRFMPSTQRAHHSPGSAAAAKRRCHCRLSFGHLHIHYCHQQQLLLLLLLLLLVQSGGSKVPAR
jgi:hypothetical protein